MPLLLLLLYILLMHTGVEGKPSLLGVYLPTLTTLMVLCFSILIKPHYFVSSNIKKLLLLIFITTISAILANRFYSMSFLYGGLTGITLYISILENRSSDKTLRRILCFLFALIICNNIMSYYERYFLINIFEHAVQENWEVDYMNVGLEYIFRSTALLGHPLNNAYCTAIFMGAILLMPLKNIIKYSLWGMCMFALLCFNARGASILSPLFLILYLTLKFFKKPSLPFFTFACFIILLLYFAAGKIMTSSLLGRLAIGAVMDGSANTRIDAWKPFFHMDAFDVLLGFNEIKYKEVCSFIRLTTMENWLASFIYKMGIPLTFAFLYYLGKIYFHALRDMDKAWRLYLLFIFITIASLNNSLSVSLWSWVWTYVVFVTVNYTCSHGFKPDSFITRWVFTQKRS